MSNGKYQDFLKERDCDSAAFRPGDIVDRKGNSVGRHKGIAYYTIGQRKGIGAHAVPRYVVEIDTVNNRVVIGGGDDLLHRELVACAVNWIAVEEQSGKMEVKARIRYGHSEQAAVITPLGSRKVKVSFIEPVRAPSPGQAVVFYDGDRVLGGGWIDSVT